MPDIPGRDKLERKLARELGAILAAQFGHLLEALGDPPSIDNLPHDFWTKEGAKLLAAFPFLEDVFLAQAARLMEEVTVGVDWTLVNEAAAKWSERYSFELVTHINETSRKGLQQAIARYYREAGTIAEAEERVARYEEFTKRAGRLYGPARVENIVVTEITRASVEGEIAAINVLADQDVLMRAFWQTNRDERVCPICRPLNGREADGYTQGRRPYWIHPGGARGADKFQGKQYGPPPSAHPHDRCWVNWKLPRS